MLIIEFYRNVHLLNCVQPQRKQTLGHGFFIPFDLAKETSSKVFAQVTTTEFTSCVILEGISYIKRKIFHRLLFYCKWLNRPVGKHPLSGPVYFLLHSLPRCHWCRKNGTQAHEADHPRACPLSQSHGGCFQNLSETHCSSGTHR